MAAAPQDLKQKLDSFVRKYHRNEMLRGCLILGASLPMAWLAVIGLEAFGRFGTSARTALFYLFVAVVAWVAVRYILLPVMRLIRLQAGLNHDDAARIIGRHFPEIEDRLLNTLQLQESSKGQDVASQELLEASIAQRSQELKPYRFTSAVDFGENRK